MAILLQQKNFGPNVVYYAWRAQSQIKKNAKSLISFLGTLEMCPKSKLNFEIIYFVLREQREGANSEIKKRRKLKKS